jgi:uncharacterized protein (TIGR02466 family)
MGGTCRSFLVRVRMPAKSYFPTLLWITKAPSSRASALNRQLLQEAYGIRELDPQGLKWSRENYPAGYTSYSSVTDLPFRSTNFDRLRKWIDGEVKRYARHLEMDLCGGKLEMRTCWLNIMGKYSHHSSHLHPLSAISGTYYVSVPKGSGGFKIEDPRMAAFMGSPPRRAKAAERNLRHVDLKPESGKLILFESWLRHEVPANRVTADRVSVSFNYDWVK